jgi:hypothetical protein
MIKCYHNKLIGYCNHLYNILQLGCWLHCIVYNVCYMFYKLSNVPVSKQHTLHNVYMLSLCVKTNTWSALCTDKHTCIILIIHIVFYVRL